MYQTCQRVRFEARGGVQLNGLLFGKQLSPRMIIFIHGLSSSAFSMSGVVEELVDRSTSVLTFNNRGHDVISRLSRKGKKSVLAGAAHEKFTDCVDDIDAAVKFAKKQGAKDIYLAGHSTGCQKSVYWAAKGGKGVKGIILLAPVSDYAAGLKKYGKNKLQTTEKVARALVEKGRKHTLLPSEVWPETLDAQRFLSLYTPNGTEEIFCYVQPKKNPTLLKHVKLPLLALWASKDEYSNTSVKHIIEWFTQNISSKKSHVLAISNATHSFKGKERQVKNEVMRWIA